ncbi:DNA glycosylase AlkZ-like family protein [Streptomyces sp. NPDC014735]|uniref:DNA glycosylase AlkZ-like family protein n=1 Tax=unclassified Streptomyces TaxID=2593676 RepID=UPI0036F74056
MDPYPGLRPDDLSVQLLDRFAVRLILMRSTVHLVTADDCFWLRPTAQSSVDRAVGPRGWRKLEGAEPAELVPFPATFAPSHRPARTPPRP